MKIALRYFNRGNSKIAILIFLFLMNGQFALYGQNNRSELKLKGGTTGPEATFKGFNFPSHDSILHLNLEPIVMIGPYHFKNKRDEKKYNQMELNVLKTYPLALIVSSEIKIVNAEFENSYTDPSRRKTYIKWYQKYVYKNYIDSLRTLNTEQGRLLLRLIHRETGKTPFDLIKSYRGGLNAVFWQSMAFMAGGNLNSKYDPAENPMIEHIIQRYKSGEFN